MQISMQRTWLWVLGIGLALLVLAQLGDPALPRTIAWLDLAAAAISFIGAVLTQSSIDRGVRAAGTIALALGLLALWIIGMTEAYPAWVTWWNFAFGFVYLVVGIATASVKRRGGTHEQTVTFRRSA
jgi:phosphatidylglycerophosphate synthase